MKTAEVSYFRATSEIVLIPCQNPFNDILKLKTKTVTQTSFKTFENNTTQRCINLMHPLRKDGRNVSEVSAFLL